MCNWYGGQKWVHHLEWDGKEAFNKSPNTTWHVDGRPAGTAVSANALTFLKVSDAGHSKTLTLLKSIHELHTAKTVWIIFFVCALNGKIARIIFCTPTVIVVPMNKPKVALSMLSNLFSGGQWN